jgi:hypothetical protein
MNLLEMGNGEWETELDRVLHDNFESEAKELLIEELINDINIEREVIEAILEHNGIDFN